MGSRQSNSRNATNHTATSPTTKEDFDSLGLQMSNVPADFAAQLDGLQRQLEMSERKRSSAEEEVRAPGYISPHGSLDFTARARADTYAHNCTHHLSIVRKPAPQPCTSHMGYCPQFEPPSVCTLFLSLNPLAHRMPAPIYPCRPSELLRPFRCDEEPHVACNGHGRFVQCKKAAATLTDRSPFHFRRAASHSLGRLAA
jgi:hypothetical protein